MSLGVMDNIWFPGSVLKFNYDHNNSSKISSVNLNRAPMTLSIGLETAAGVDPAYLTYYVENPTLSNVRTAVGTMVNNIGLNANIPTALTCDIIEITSDESLNIALGLNVNYGSISINAKADHLSETHKTHAAMIFKQIYYTIDMDRPTNGAEGVFGKDVSVDDLQTITENGDTLAYTSVVYGKVAVITINTDMSMAELKATMAAGYGSIASLKGSIETAFSESNTSMNYFVYGGSDELMGLITSDTLDDVATAIASSNNVSPKPIGYRFYYLDDGNVAKVASYNEYITREQIPIMVENVEITMRDLYTNNPTIEALPGATLLASDTITPMDAIILDSKRYDINADAWNYAMINPETGRLVIDADANVGDVITVTLTVTQTIQGSQHVKKSTYNIEIIPIPVESIFIESTTTNNGEMSPGESLSFIALISPHDATYKNVRWSVSGNATISVNDDGSCILRISTTAKSGDSVVLTAKDYSGNVTRSIPITVTEGLSPDVIEILLSSDYVGMDYYPISSTTKKITIIGEYGSDASAIIQGFSLKIEGRNSPLEIVLNNVAFKAVPGKDAIYVDPTAVENNSNYLLTITTIGNVALFGADSTVNGTFSAINVANLCIDVGSSLKAYGGNGTDYNGMNGLDGGVGIKSSTLTVKGNGLLISVGGDGFKGKDGLTGTTGTAGRNASSISVGATNGTDGTDGGNGGSGGNGGIGVMSETITVQGSVTLNFVGGNGGSGGDGKNLSKYASSPKHGAHGGNGGAAGIGGNGGNGGLSVTSSSSLSGHTLVDGIGGNGGNGGNGGDAGNGGNGTETSWWYIIFPVVSNGGNTGVVGDGGSGGNGGDGSIGGNGGDAGIVGNAGIAGERGAVRATGTSTVARGNPGSVSTVVALPGLPGINGSII